MHGYAIFEEALQAITGNTLRSLLTIIGIVVGIFSVTAMLALGEGLSTNILERFDSFTAGDITISGTLSENNLTWVQEQPYVEAALATARLDDIEAIVGTESFSPSVSFSIGDYEAVQGITLVSGTVFDFASTTYDEKVALVDEGFVEAVQENAGIDISSGTIVLNGTRFLVIGVYEGGTGGFGRWGDGSIIVPYKAAVGVLTNTSQFSSIGVNLVDEAYYEIAATHILEALNVSEALAKDNDEAFSVSSAKEAIEAAQETTGMISLFLGIIGGIALFVGGIGTMNMMLTTVTERTKEIGLRKAVGARNSDILLQILTESVLLSVTGGVIGIILSYGASLVANSILTEDSIIAVSMSGTVVFYATLVAFLVGIIFGLYPARKASLLMPVDALRAE